MGTKNWYRTDIKFDKSAISEFGQAKIKELKEEGIANGASLRNLYLPENPVFTDEWMSYIRSMGLEPMVALMFYRTPHFQYPDAHIDGGRKRKIIMGLNWVEGEDDSKMIWYDMPRLEYKPDMETIIGHVFNYPYNPADLTENEAATIGNSSTLALVRTDIPHNIWMGANPRLSISVRFWDNYKNWDDAVEFYKDHII